MSLLLWIWVTSCWRDSRFPISARGSESYSIHKVCCNKSTVNPIHNGFCNKSLVYPIHKGCGIKSTFYPIHKFCFNKRTFKPIHVITDVIRIRFIQFVTVAVIRLHAMVYPIHNIYNNNNPENPVAGTKIRFTKIIITVAVIVIRFTQYNIAVAGNNIIHSFHSGCCKNLTEYSLYYSCSKNKKIQQIHNGCRNNQTIIKL